ncbi:hypothetical protein [Actinoallomurus rhizosphaericola]|uniref:hypothetical protein n=1 Tax=Actinoallomurus rhizosphaericola TaxID=2952536 RepID=UPI00209201FD|nr:hypothetical protein [Actinoallomurus rhizosphaericola]MCO6000030.1 hypothetical protein [Actinoallomurus rhizosphaericola]
MSFGVHARKVRDTTLPYGRRVSALRSCVQLYRPIGFHATLSFLEELAGPFGRDEAALLRALDALIESREAWKADVRAYAAMRARAKRHGRRGPRPTDPDPGRFPGHWYGAPGRAALHALEFWRRSRLPALLEPPDPVTEDLNLCVDASLRSGGPLTGEQRRMLDACVTELRRRQEEPGRWPGGQAAYFRFRDLLTVARFVQTAAEAG